MKHNFKKIEPKWQKKWVFLVIHTAKLRRTRKRQQ